MAPVDRLTCEETFRRLDDYLDRQLTPEERERVAEHLDTCAACAAEYRFETSLLEQLKGKLSRIHFPLDLRSRIVQELARERRNGNGNGAGANGRTS